MGRTELSLTLRKCRYHPALIYPYAARPDQCAAQCTCGGMRKHRQREKVLKKSVASEVGESESVAETERGETEQQKHQTGVGKVNQDDS